MIKVYILCDRDGTLDQKGELNINLAKAIAKEKAGANVDEVILCTSYQVSQLQNPSVNTLRKNTLTVARRQAGMEIDSAMLTYSPWLDEDNFGSHATAVIQLESIIERLLTSRVAGYINIGQNLRAILQARIPAPAIATASEDAKANRAAVEATANQMAEMYDHLPLYQELVTTFDCLHQAEQQFAERLARGELVSPHVNEANNITERDMGGKKPMLSHVTNAARMDQAGDDKLYIIFDDSELVGQTVTALEQEVSHQGQGNKFHFVKVNPNELQEYGESEYLQTRYRNVIRRAIQKNYPGVQSKDTTSIPNLHLTKPVTEAILETYNKLQGIRRIALEDNDHAQIAEVGETQIINGENGNVNSRVFKDFHMAVKYFIDASYLISDPKEQFAYLKNIKQLLGVLYNKKFAMLASDMTKQGFTTLSPKAEQKRREQAGKGNSSSNIIPGLIERHEMAIRDHGIRQTQISELMKLVSVKEPKFWDNVVSQIIPNLFDINEYARLMQHIEEFRDLVDLTTQLEMQFALNAIDSIAGGNDLSNADKLFLHKIRSLYVNIQENKVGLHHLIHFIEFCVGSELLSDEMDDALNTILNSFKPLLSGKKEEQFNPDVKQRVKEIFAQTSGSSMFKRSLLTAAKLSDVMNEILSPKNYLLDVSQRSMYVNPKYLPKEFKK